MSNEDRQRRTDDDSNNAPDARDLPLADDDDREGQRLTADARSEDPGTLNVQLAEEELEAHVTERQLGRLRISKRVNEEPQVADIELHHDDVQVDRTAVNEFVTEPKGPWYDGDTLVIPVYEEQLVTEVRLILKEEIRVRNTQQTERVKIRETARKEVLDFETIPEDEDEQRR